MFLRSLTGSVRTQRMSFQFAAFLITVVMLSVVRATAQVATPTPVTTGTFIQPSSVPPRISLFFQAMGSRMTTAATAAITLSGTTTDANGSRAAQIIVQYPGLLSYSEGQTRVITFKWNSISNHDGPNNHCRRTDCRKPHGSSTGFCFSADDQRRHLPTRWRAFSTKLKYSSNLLRADLDAVCVCAQWNSRSYARPSASAKSIRRVRRTYRANR